MSNIIKLSFGCMLALVFAGTVQAEIYQSKDDQGQTVFTDTPPPGLPASRPHPAVHRR